MLRYAHAITIIPEDKDWTWVLERPCPACGFDAAGVDPPAVAEALKEALPRWDLVPRRNDVRERPSPGVWSPLEYACHVRDVFELFRYRLGLMVGEDGARFENWDQDATAVERGYTTSDPVTVRRELAETGKAARAAFADVPPERCCQRGVRSNGSENSVLIPAKRCYTRILVHASHSGLIYMDFITGAARKMKAIFFSKHRRGATYTQVARAQSAGKTQDLSTPELSLNSRNTLILPNLNVAVHGHNMETL